ncbi:glycoside hydrolase superfamily [Mycena rosella]|uniref:glucan 1,3-beta-glucosidase n=1 Tax=Mycena rosella TaxID=1033263 RepID=A0AAD7BJG2_MYCRO|nr:glycoside hydrolase superfamily [Mycena rosella]
MLTPFAVITPALFQAYPSAPDEWMLRSLMCRDGTLQGTMENHYDTFITEQDIVQITGVGLNWVRLLIPFWAVSTWSGVGTDGTGEVAEPFLEFMCWNALDYIRTITEFISQPEWRDVVPMFGIVNKALMSTIGRDQLTSFYLHAHDMIHGITVSAQATGPSSACTTGFLPGSDRIILDTHPYFAFDQQATAPRVQVGCGRSRSQAYSGDCNLWQDASMWNSTVKAGVLQFALASMDTMQDWFFWTWKLGLEGGWMPTDSHIAVGKCVAVGVSEMLFPGPSARGRRAARARARASEEFGTWPPMMISLVDMVVLMVLPTYTATGSMNAAQVMPTVSVGDRWFDVGIRRQR